MSFFRPQFRPGINKRDTGLQNEGGFSDSDLVRARGGLYQPIGGWQPLVHKQFEGKARGNHAWRTLEGKRVYAFGTSTALYALVGGSLLDITPPLHDTVLKDVFTTVSGSPTVTVTLPFHRLVKGQSVTFSNHQTTVGGLTIEGTFAVTDVLSTGTFTITFGSNATSPVTTPGGGYVDFFSTLIDGLDDTPATGYGTGTYGSGPYGTSGETVNELRTWSLDNWGENGLFNPSGFGLFEWQPEIAYPELIFNGTFTGNADGWAMGTGWAYGANKANATAGTISNLSQNVSDVAEGGRTFRITFDVTRTAGSIKFRVNAGTTPAVIDVAEASSPIQKTGTYSRIFLCPADPQDIVFEKDASFAGSIDNVSFELEDKAYRITTAPPRIDYMFVDPRGIVILLGTTFVDGTYSPMAVRTSDLGNNRSWVPDTDSLATEIPLRGSGGRLMAGLATSEQNLVWSDDGVFSLQYNGTAGKAYADNLLGTKCGLMSRHAMAEENGFVMWASNTRQWFIFRGVSSNALGKPEMVESNLQEDVFNNFDFLQALKCHGGINPEFTEFWFFYPDTRDGNECSRVVTLNWTTGEWAPHVMARTSWQASGVFPNPIALTPDGIIYEQETGRTANGALLAARLKTGDFDADEGDFLLIFKGIIPDFKDQDGSIVFRISGKNYPNEPLRFLGDHTSLPTSARLNFRYKCRQYVVEILWVTTGGWGRCGANRFDIGKTAASK